MTGWAIRRRSRRGRLAALALAIPNLVLVPFGTALGVYTFWVLLNNDARRAFGRLWAASGLAPFALAQRVPPAEELRAANQRRRNAAQNLVKFDLPMATEPAFVFRP